MMDGLYDLLACGGVFLRRLKVRKPFINIIMIIVM